MACVFIDIGQDVHIIGGNLEEAINEGVRPVSYTHLI